MMAARIHTLPLLTLLVAACGSGQSSTEVAPAPAPQEADSPEAKAEVAFAELSAELDKLGKGDPVDVVWLERQLDAVLKLNPKHITARYNKAVLLERAGKAKAARALYEQVMDDDDEYAPAAENVAAYLLAEGNRGKALEIYREAIERDPKNVTSRLALARILAEERQYDDAIKLARQALERKGDAIEAFRVLAKSYKAVGNVPMAELIVGRGLKVDENDVELHVITAEIMLDRNQLTDAVKKLKQIVAMAPARVQVRAQLADIALSYRDFGNAAQQFAAIVKHAPDDRGAQIGLAVSLKGLGRYDEAEKIYKGLLQQNPKDPDALWNLGVLYHRHLLRYDDAVAAFSQFESVADAGDPKVKEVPERIAQIKKEKADIAAAQARAEKEQKRLAAIETTCKAVAAGQPAKPEDIGEEQERIEVAWQLLLTAREHNAAGDIPGGEAAAKCAFAVVPNSQKAALEACAPMYVVWVQELYGQNRLVEAQAATDKALACDPNNPDALLIKQQLAEIIATQQAEAAAASSGPGASEQPPGPGVSGTGGGAR